MKIINETPFSIPVDSFAIGASETGYQLNFSVDGRTWTEYGEAVPAGENCVVTNASKHLLYKLVGNNGDVLISY